MHQDGKVSPGKFDALDAWRAIAALSVVVYHTALPAVTSLYPQLAELALFRNIRFGAYGVQIFFVISGYCIAQAALNSLARRDGVGGFVYARAKRIYPPYFFTSILAILTSALAYYLTTMHVIPSSNFSQNALFAKDPYYYACSALLLQKVCDIDPLLPLFWTLCYEAAFYLVVAVFLSMALRCGGRTMLLDGLHGLTIACAAVSSMVPDALPYPFDLWPQFGLGVLVFDVLTLRRGPHVPFLLVCAMALMSIYAWRSAAVGENFARAIPGEEAIAAVLFALLLLATYSRDRFIANILPVRWLRVIGVFSYSLYLTHGITIAFVSQIGKRLHLVGYAYPISMVAQTVVAVAAAWLFFLVAERPFMNKSHRRRVDAALPVQLAPSPL